MNKSTINKQLAINYTVLRRLVQNDHLVHSRIHKDNIQELMDVRKFYETYFESTKFVQYFPQVCQLIKRETESAFARLRQRVYIVHKYDEAYPKALIQDLKEDAPLFLYLCGDNSLLERKVKRVSIVTTLNREDAYIEESKHICSAFENGHMTVMLQNRSAVDHVLFEQLKDSNVSMIYFVNTPLMKDDTAEKICKSHCPKYAMLSFVGPTEDGLEDFMRLKIMNSLGKVTVLLSDQPNDVNHFSIQNNYAWHKPSILPMIKPSMIPHFERVFALDDSESFIDVLNNCIS